MRFELTLGAQLTISDQSLGYNWSRTVRRPSRAGSPVSSVFTPRSTFRVNSVNSKASLINASP